MVVDIEARELSPGVTAITFTGRLVLGNRLGEVEHAIREKIKQGSRKLVLDFSGLKFIDSAGIGMLAMWFGLMEREGGKIAIAGATTQVNHLLEMTHLNRLLGMYPDVASAHSALAELRSARAA
jgi:anti-sigma B factor antagonist